MTDVFNKPGSSVYHAQMRCSGTYVPPAGAISRTAAENRGLRPCGSCTPDEWRDDD